MDDKEKALGAALSQIERQFGKGSVMRLLTSALFPKAEWDIPLKSIG